MGYRRFIAYVYEYRKGKKEDNCGFMKVEVRNHMCTIEPHLQVEKPGSRRSVQSIWICAKRGTDEWNFAGQLQNGGK